MATPQALGSGLAGYNPFLPSDTNAKLRQIQLQQQLGQELQQQGLTPINTNNRQIGNIGYAISPTEGIAKLAQALVGGYEQNDANNKYADALKNMGGTSGQSGAPSANMMAALYPEEAAKAMLGDHRPGASYWTPGGMQQSPTDLQINTGTTPNSPQQPSPPMPMPPSQGDPGGGAPAPQVPVQGPVPAAPIPGVPSTAPDPLAQYRQANGMATPPIDPQRQAMGLPTGSNIPMGNPQVNASQLSAPPVPPQPASSVPLPNVPQGTLPPQAALPTPMPGESPLHFQARLEVAKDVSAAQAKAPIAAAQAGATAQASKQGENIAEAQRGMSQIDSRIGNAKDIINQMKTLAPNVPYGPHGIAQMQVDASDMPVVGSGKASSNYHTFDTLNQNLFTQELPGIVGASGGRIDIPLVNAIKGASAVDIDAHPAAKLATLNQLSTMLDRVQSNAHQNLQNLSGIPQPVNNSQAGVTHIFVPGKGIQPVGQ